MNLTLYVDVYPGVDPATVKADPAPPAQVAGGILGGRRYRFTLAVPDPMVPANVVQPGAVVPVTPAPSIQINPAEGVTFNATVGLAAPWETVREVANAGDPGSELDIAVATDAGWLTAHEAPNDGPQPKGDHTHVVIGANHAGLEPGTYTGLVILTDANASNSPAHISVTLVVAAA
jgi:hypothetical protein